MRTFLKAIAHESAHARGCAYGKLVCPEKGGAAWYHDWLPTPRRLATFRRAAHRCSLEPGVPRCMLVEMKGEPGASSRSMRERMLAGELYIADDPELAEASARALELLAAYNATTVRQAPLRRHLLEELLGSLGEGTTIRPPLFLDYGVHIHFGARCFANFGLVALDVASITIGDDVQIGPNVQLLTPTHPVDAEPRRQKWEAAEPIAIGNNVWLGGGAIVLPGVSIGENTVIGAGAVVTRDIAANCIAVGNPARVIRTLAPDD